MRLVSDRIASPSEIAEELGAPLGNVSYHVRYLERVGLLKLVKTRPRRGAVEHYYKTAGRLRITDAAWAQVPAMVKDAMLDATLAQVMRYVGAAAALGGFDRKEAHLSRWRLVLDAQGFKELAATMKQFLDRAREIETESMQRLADTDHEDEISVGTVLMMFEAPPAAAGLPEVPERKRSVSEPRRPRTRKASTPGVNDRR